MTAFSNISNSEIGVDADVDSVTFLRLRDNGTHLKEVVDAAPGSPKIPGQQIATQAAASGLGLRANQFNFLLQTLVIVVSADVPPTDTVTSIAASASRIPLMAVSVAGAGTYAITASVVFKQTTPNYIVRLRRDAGGTGTQTVTVHFYAIARL